MRTGNLRLKRRNTASSRSLTRFVAPSTSTFAWRSDRNPSWWAMQTHHPEAYTSRWLHSGWRNQVALAVENFRLAATFQVALWPAHPELHELGLQAGGCLMVLLPAAAQQPVHLIDEDDGRLQLGR